MTPFFAEAKAQEQCLFLDWKFKLLSVEDPEILGSISSPSDGSDFPRGGSKIYRKNDLTFRFTSKIKLSSCISFDPSLTALLSNISFTLSSDERFYLYLLVPSHLQIDTNNEENLLLL